MTLAARLSPEERSRYDHLVARYRALCASLGYQQAVETLHDEEVSAQAVAGSPAEHATLDHAFTAFWRGHVEYLDEIRRGTPDDTPPSRG